MIHLPYRFFFSALCMLLFMGSLHGEPTLNGYYPINEKQAAGLATRLELKGPVSLSLNWPKPAEKPLHIALLVPQTTDTWKTFIYAVTQAAQRLNIGLTVYSAQSYLNLGRQIKQLGKDTINMDGVILAAINSHKMARIINTTPPNRPIVGYANEVFAKGISAKAMVYYHDVTYRLGQWVRKHIKQTKPNGKVRIAFVMGPKSAGWSQDMISGFKKAIADDPELMERVEFVSELHGHTKPNMQERLVRVTLRNHEKIDYLFGTAPAIERAAALKAQFNQRHPNLNLIAPYINADIYDIIQEGKVLVSANDNMISIGEIAVIQLLRLIRGEKPTHKSKDFAYVTGPQSQLITRDNAKEFTYEALFGSKEFIPVVIGK